MTPPLLNQLANDTDRDLFRGLRPNLNPNRGNDPGLVLRSEPLFCQGLQQSLPFASAPDQTDEAGFTPQRLPNRRKIVQMSGRGDDDVVVKVALLNPTVFQGDRSIYCSGEAKGNSGLHLGRDGVRVDNPAAVDGAHHPADLHLTLGPE